MQRPTLARIAWKETDGSTQGRRLDYSLKGAEYGDSPLGGQQSYFFLNSLSKLGLSQDFLLLNYAIGGARAPAGPP
jgi:hypothetical protein